MSPTCPVRIVPPAFGCCGDGATVVVDDALLTGGLGGRVDTGGLVGAAGPQLPSISPPSPMPSSRIADRLFWTMNACSLIGLPFGRCNSLQRSVGPHVDQDGLTSRRTFRRLRKGRR